MKIVLRILKSVLLLLLLIVFVPFILSQGPAFLHNKVAAIVQMKTVDGEEKAQKPLNSPPQESPSDNDEAKERKESTLYPRSEPPAPSPTAKPVTTESPEIKAAEADPDDESYKYLEANASGKTSDGDASGQNGADTGTESKESANPYSSVIKKYKTAMENGGDYRGESYEDRVSEWTSNYAHVGYALIDFDGDGTDEIIIGGIDPDDSYPSVFPPIVYEIDTIVDGTPVRLFVSEARSRYFLMKDNRLLRFGSNSASDASYEMLKVSGGQLDFVEGMRTGNSTDRSGQTIYHTTASRRSPDGKAVYGNFDTPDSSVPNSGLAEFVNGLYSECYMPELTKIA